MMARNDRRKGDEPLVLALAVGKTVRDAAVEAGVSERTVFRRLEEAEFLNRVTELRGRMVESASGRLANAAGAACDRLKGLLEAASESVQLGAARTILEQAVRLRELLDLESRLKILEERCNSAHES